VSRTNDELEKDIDALWRTVQGYRAASSSDRQRRLDEFAKAALTGVLAMPEHPDVQPINLSLESHTTAIAQAAYNIAASMLAESDRRSKEQA